jgi:hypothetical protein
MGVLLLRGLPGTPARRVYRYLGRYAQAAKLLEAELAALPDAVKSAEWAVPYQHDLAGRACAAVDVIRNGCSTGWRSGGFWFGAHGRPAPRSISLLADGWREPLVAGLAELQP